MSIIKPVELPAIIPQMRQIERRAKIGIAISTLLLFGATATVVMAYTGHLSPLAGRVIPLVGSLIPFLGASAFSLRYSKIFKQEPKLAKVLKCWRNFALISTGLAATASIGFFVAGQLLGQSNIISVTSHVSNAAGVLGGIGALTAATELQEVFAGFRASRSVERQLQTKAQKALKEITVLLGRLRGEKQYYNDRIHLLNRKPGRPADFDPAIRAYEALKQAYEAFLKKPSKEAFAPVRDANREAFKQFEELRFRFQPFPTISFSHRRIQERFRYPAKKPADRLEDLMLSFAEARLVEQENLPLEERARKMCEEFPKHSPTDLEEVVEQFKTWFAAFPKALQSQAVFHAPNTQASLPRR